MITLLSHLSHVEIAAPDVEASVAFYEERLGLRQVGRDGGKAYLRSWGDYTHHSVVISEGPEPALVEIGWRTTSAEALEEAARRVEDAGVTGEWSDSGPGRGRSYVFTGPWGHTIRLAWDIEQYEADDEHASIYPDRPERRSSVAGERVVEQQAGTRHAAAALDGVQRRVRHRLDAERHDGLRDAGLHLHRGVEHGLQTRSATPIELVAVRRDGESRIERSHPTDRRRLHRRVSLGADDPVDRGRVDARSLEQRAEHGRREFERRHGREGAAHAADGGAQRGAHHDVAELGHAMAPRVSIRVRLRRALLVHRSVRPRRALLDHRSLTGRLRR